MYLNLLGEAYKKVAYGIVLPNRYSGQSHIAINEKFQDLDSEGQKSLAELKAKYGLKNSELADRLYDLSEKHAKSKSHADIASTYKELISLVL